MAWLIFYLLLSAYVFYLGVSEKSTSYYPESPEEGDKVEITWLPNPRNNPRSINCYIGSTGVVDKVKKDGAFDLKMESGATLIVHTNYKFKKL
jgi:hypothetical protein